MSFREVTTVSDRPCFSYQCVQFFFTVYFVVRGILEKPLQGQHRICFWSLRREVNRLSGGRALGYPTSCNHRVWA